MPCNAYNHPADCECGWGGVNYGTGGGSGWINTVVEPTIPRTITWTSDEDSFTRPTRCPHCGADVYFVRHNGGSVWFDELGPPWPKHGCFDTEPDTYWRDPVTSTSTFTLGLVIAIETIDYETSKLTIQTPSRRTDRIVRKLGGVREHIGALVLVGETDLTFVSRRPVTPAYHGTEAETILAILRDLAQRFPDGVPIGHITSLARAKGLPQQAVRDVLSRLEAGGYVEQPSRGLWKTITKVAPPETMPAEATNQTPIQSPSNVPETLQQDSSNIDNGGSV